MDIYISRVVATHVGLLSFSSSPSEVIATKKSLQIMSSSFSLSLSLSQIFLSSLSRILHVTFVEVFTVFFVIIVNPTTTIWVATRKQNS
jgi:hypothetical protein